MRIIAGKCRGLKLAPVGKGDPDAHLRPTTDRVRENIFNLLTGGPYGDPLTGARVLDLFAGTGALGLEAYSRGAAQVTFVDDGARAISILRKNIALCRAAESTQVLRRDALRLGERRGAQFDLVFIDPPYGKGLGEKAMAAARDHGWLSKTALVLLEEGKEIPAPAGFRRLARRRYGDTFILIFEPDAEQ